MLVILKGRDMFIGTYILRYCLSGDFIGISKIAEIVAREVKLYACDQAVTVATSSKVVAVRKIVSDLNFSEFTISK